MSKTTTVLKEIQNKEFELLLKEYQEYKILKKQIEDKLKDFEATIKNTLDVEYTEYLGNKVVCHSLPIRPGRNLAVIVEAAAVNHRQKKMGYNAAKELYRRVQENLMRGDDEDEFI
jgi:HPr kinase/phosphorylase